jgi:hypothetical protein
VDQAVQIAGAVLILIAFVAAQLGALRPDAVWYLVLNLVGSVALTIDAWWGRQWGFFLLEAVWAVVSLGGLVATLRGRRGSAGH